MSRKLALVIGNTEYRDRRLARLESPRADVVELASVLRSVDIGGFSDVHPLLNEPAPSIVREIGRFFGGDRRSDDLLLLYFSGHGVRHEGGDLYLAAVDTETDFLSSTAVPASYVRAEIDSSRSQRIVLILDCCHGGAFMRGAKAAVGMSVDTRGTFAGNGSGRIILTATDSMQYAWEGDSVSGEAPSSVFTHHLVQGLRTGAADLNSDGQITVDELYQYVHDEVVKQTPNQRPRKFVINQDGGLAIAAVPLDLVRPVELPPELVAAMHSLSAGAREDAVRELDGWLRGGHAGRMLAAERALRALAQDDSRRVMAAAVVSLEGLAARQRRDDAERAGSSGGTEARTTPAGEAPATAEPASTARRLLPDRPGTPAARASGGAEGRRAGPRFSWASVPSSMKLASGLAALILAALTLALMRPSLPWPGLVRPSPAPRPTATPQAPKPASWSAAAPMGTARESHTLTALPDGRVLAVGGYNPNPVLNGVEIYDPSKNSWSAAASMNAPHADHTSTLLTDGRVLVVAGFGADLHSSTAAEVYDPRSNTWKPAGNLRDPRVNHRAVLLMNGKVLVVGGLNRSGPLASAELWDPASSTWSQAPDMSTPRSAPTATLLKDGRVLVAGGDSAPAGATTGAPQASAEIYDYRSNRWSRTGSMSARREEHTATLLGDGRVLVIGGVDQASAELYSPATGSWSPAGSPSVGRREHVAVLLSSGSVLVAGGAQGNAVIGGCERYDPAANAWSSAPAMSSARWLHAAVSLPGGPVLVAGGGPETGSNAVASTEIYR